MDLETQLAEAEAENARLKDERIAVLRRQIAVLQFQLDAMLGAKLAKAEALNRELRAALPKRKPSPLKGRRVLEDYECAVSTFIARHGGIKIPKNLREEFGGWNRLHRDDALAADEMAELVCEYGLITEPTTNSLLDGLKSGRKSAREPSAKDYYAWCEEQVKAREANEAPF